MEKEEKAGEDSGSEINKNRDIIWIIIIFIVLIVLIIIIVIILFFFTEKRKITAGPGIENIDVLENKKLLISLEESYEEDANNVKFILKDKNNEQYSFETNNIKSLNYLLPAKDFGITDFNNIQEAFVVFSYQEAPKTEDKYSIPGYCEGDSKCDDGISCTRDTCDNHSCSHIPNNSSCSDGNYCNGLEYCALGEGCISGTPVDCSNLNEACMQGICSETNKSCIKIPGLNGNSCNDNANCTINDICLNGTCTGTPDNTKCSDNIACTSDLCFNKTCSYIPNDNLCNLTQFCNPVNGCSQITCANCTDCDNSFGDCNYDKCHNSCNRINGCYYDGNSLGEKCIDSIYACYSFIKNCSDYNLLECQNDLCNLDCKIEGERCVKKSYNCSQMSCLDYQESDCEKNPCGFNCKLDGGKCIGKGNNKNMEMYGNKEVFLISDSDWKNILTLVPLTTWNSQNENEQCKKGYGTPGNVCVYPMLIYHEETNSFDADSIIYFMQQYNTDKITIFGQTPQDLDNLLVTQPILGVGVNRDKIQRINIGNYLNYWQNFNDVVYVEDNYELALIASEYASLINSPLIIKGTSIDNPEVLRNKNIICVGNINLPENTCSERYDLVSLQKKYVSVSQTKKIILVNPDDLNIKVSKEYTPDKSSSISNIYTKDSLAAPILAAAKNEIIFTVKSTDMKTVDNEFTLKLQDFFGITTSQSSEILPYFLTIISSPATIPMQRSVCAKNEVDGRVYASLENDKLINIPVGRITGISVSDVSGNIARSVFFSELPKNKDALIVERVNMQSGLSGNSQAALEKYARGLYWTDQIRSQFDNEYFYAGTTYVDSKKSEIYQKYPDAFLKTFEDHGHSDMFVGMMDVPYMKQNKINLKPSLVLGLACLTCKYAGTGDSFCIQGIRRGAIAQQGATDLSYWHQELDDILKSAFLENKTIGEAYLIGRNADYTANHYNFCGSIRGDPYYLLLGDPTWRPRWW